MGLVDMEVEKVADEVTDMVADRMMDEMDEKSWKWMTLNKMEENCWHFMKMDDVGWYGYGWKFIMLDEMVDNGWLWMKINRGGCKLRTLREMGEKWWFEKVKEAKIVKKVKMSDGSWRFACGEVFYIESELIQLDLSNGGCQKSNYSYSCS